MHINSLLFFSSLLHAEFHIDIDKYVFRSSIKLHWGWGVPAIAEVGSCLSQLGIMTDTSKVCFLHVLWPVLLSVPASTGILIKLLKMTLMKEVFRMTTYFICFRYS